MIEYISKIFRYILIKMHQIVNYNLYKNKVKIFGIPFLVHRKNISIGENSRINPSVVMYGHGGIEIGENVTLSHGVSIYSTGYDTNEWENNKINKIHKSGSVKIEKNSWIGANSIILKDVTIAEGCVVAAGSVVIKSLQEPNTLYAGNPAQKVKSLIIE